MDYQLLQDKQINEILSSSKHKKPSLLLHACCAPCSSYVIEYLSSIFSISIYYFNPNIYPPEEYVRRLSELNTFLLNTKPLFGQIPLITTEYNPDSFYQYLGIDLNPELINEAERGERCRRCYKFRMETAAKYADNNHFDYFTTTLSISPYKDASKINTIGQNLPLTFTKYLYADFKKRNGFLRSLKLSTQYNLYRQDYCGCIYSKLNRL